MVQRDSNMNARVPSSLLGVSSAVLALAYVSASGPWLANVLCSEPPPGVNPVAFAS